MSKEVQADRMLRVVELAMRLGHMHLSRYGSYKSRHDFTQSQLMTCLILRTYLKTTYRLIERHAQPTLDAVARDMAISPASVHSLAAKLIRHRLLELSDRTLRLTDSGRRRAEELIRSHRLWETYLADRLHMDDAAIHDSAERLEHAHELADEIDATLGHPRTDPQGKPIPPN